MTSQDPHLPHSVQRAKSGPNWPLIVSLLIVAVLLIGLGALFVFGKGKGESQEPLTNVAVGGPLSSGGVVFQKDLSAVQTSPAEAGVPLTPTPTLRDSGTVDILVYVDYRCPHCMAFEQANNQVLKSALESGTATVEVRPLTFMDRYSAGSEYSSRAANAFVCTAVNAPQSAWLLHNVLLNPSVQPQGEGPGHDNEILVEIVEAATSQSDSRLRECILSNEYVGFVQAVNEWTFENPVPFANDKNLTVQGTPLVVAAGEVYTGDIDNAAEFKNFLAGQGVVFDQ